jgi:predicted secreted protein
MRAAAAGLALCALASPGRAETVLHLSETATVSVRPDRLTAVLRADASTDSASTAQDRVNAVIGGALAEARKVDGIAVSTDQYNVWRLEPKAGEAAQWRASQSVVLRGQDGSSVLKLVGALQQEGLAVERLGWELAPETAQSAERTATLQALKALRGRADEVAGAVGLQSDAYRSLTVGSAPPTPIRLRTMAVPAAALASPAEPAAEAEDVRVNATVEADIALKPQ